MRFDLLEDFTRRDWQQVTTAGPLRIAMIGLGWWTQDHAIPAVKASELATTTVVVSGNAEKAEAVASEHQTITTGLTYEDFHAGGATDQYDALYICTPNALHLPFVEAAAEFDKAVLCEKPMEASLDRAEQLVEAAADIPLMIAYRLHTEPAARRMRELIQAGTIGTPVHVHGSMSQRLLEMIPDSTQWRLDPDLAGYGTSVMDLGVYPLNTTRFALDRDPVAVQATMDSLEDPFASVPDERGGFLVEYADSVFGSFTASQNAYQESFLRITGTSGTIELEPAFSLLSDSVLRVEREDRSIDFHWEPVNQMTEEFDYFADRVLSGRSIHPDGAHGLVDMRALDAIYQAAETGDRISLTA